MTETAEANIPNHFLGINPEEINKKLVSWGVSLDEIVQKLASLGLPGIVFIIAVSASSATAYPAIYALFGLGGPLGLVGGLGVLGISTIIGDIVTGYGIEALLKAVYLKRRETETQEYLIKEVDGLPISQVLKLNLKNAIEVEIASKEPVTPREVEIAEE
ncbi:MAG: hypothetical protein KA717_23270 [Woronichinia naegeliana WA131]|jgi:hypothetical protein|uniref:Uncharacterized protein n=1 Tax=Woronichinia naegeliana WA131 TaxID=2824559 RepID=A0A977KUR7_9CYAN|nr:MAG: hypothetical protein KA717_23270 [Woronichinia naegeliana WA131]